MSTKSRNTITFPLDIPEVEVTGMQVNEHGDYIITVESTRRSAICQHCGCQITKFNGHGREIELRHLPILGKRVYIRIRPKRYECPDCGDKISTQKLEWYESRSPHTKAYDRYLMLQLINSTIEDVSHKEEVTYDEVLGIIDRHLGTEVNWSGFEELGVMGIDEIALKKGHQDYVVIVTARLNDGQVKLYEAWA